jgi:bifunctional non-homologous end joining protein LigD
MGHTHSPTPRDRLAVYRAKRDFSASPEPQHGRKRGKALSFVVQKHDATRLHYDFRLELDGVLLSWAVPKGPSYDPADKRMAVQTEDHPLSYADFEGTIPAGHYGAGDVIVWDRGHWEPIGDPHEGLDKGKLAFRLHGAKLEGAWELIRMRPRGSASKSAKAQWLLIKHRGADARSHAEFDVVAERPDSVLSGPAAAPTPSDKVGKSLGKKAAMPEAIAPQLATLASEPPPDGDWIYEIKFDGYRLLTRFHRGTPQLFTRQGHDWSDKLATLQRELKELGLRDAWLDGELVALDDEGVPDFNALQNAFDRSSTRRLTYYLFDLLYLDGRDLRDEPLTARRQALKALLDGKETEYLRFSVDAGEDAASVLQAACQLKLEGVIAKRADAPYRSGRGTSWLKLKCHQRQEFVVAGFTDRLDHPGDLGSLLLGLHDERGQLKPVGAVGTGWSLRDGRELRQKLAAIETPKPPFDIERPRTGGRWQRRPNGGEHWVKPQLLAEVVFSAWTPAGQIRHASFMGLRTDKEAKMITRDQAIHPGPAAKKARTGDARAGKVRVTHPDRVIDPSTGLTKLELVRYYESVADRMLPHLQGRPVAAVRAPQGIRGQLFFQRHASTSDDDDEVPMTIGNADELLAAAQLNVIEFHTGGAKLKTPGKPDRIVFDLDPGEGVAWSHVQEGAQLVRALLNELALQSWLKTSGGKGLHVVVPIAARWTSDAVKDLSKAVVEHLAQSLPERFVAKSGPRNRVGKIFVDYLRNGEAATTVAAFSARARLGMGVSMPMAWDELDEITSGANWTVQTARDHLSFQKADPWADFATTRQSLTAAAKALGLKFARS